MTLTSGTRFSRTIFDDVEADRPLRMRRPETAGTQRSYDCYRPVLREFCHATRPVSSFSGGRGGGRPAADGAKRCALRLSGNGREVELLSRRNFNGFACSALYVLSGLSALDPAPTTAKPVIRSEPLSVAQAEWEAATENLSKWRECYQALLEACENCERRRRPCFGRSGSCNSCRAAVEAAETRGFELCELQFAAETRWHTLRQGAGA
jgi:hypothetical protein